MEKQYKCETCKDTGFYGDNGPGIKGNREYQACDQCPKVPLQKENTMEHTPGPWVLDCDRSENGDLLIRDSQDWPIINVYCLNHTPKLDLEGKANAEFIVRACNNHNELVEVCNLILDRMDLGRVASRGTNRVKSYEIKGKRGENIKDSIQLFKRAIAKAERKEV